MATITNILAREILDSRGMPTVETAIWLDNGIYVSSSVPSGTSKGKYDALEVRDNDLGRMKGTGALTAVNNVNTVLAPQLVGKDPVQQTEIDQLMISLDGSTNKAKLGANAILSISQAVCKAAAATQGLPLFEYIHQKFEITKPLSVPSCIYGLINGGEHGADNLDIQEFQIIPASFLNFADSLAMAVTLFHTLEEVLVSKGAIHSVGMVGGFAPNLYNNTDAFEILMETVKVSPYTFAQDVFFGVDMSASSFYQGGKYSLKDRPQPFSPSDLITYYKNIRQQYQVLFMEDPFQEDEWDSWQQLTAELGETTTITGDDLLATNKDRVKQAIEKKACNAIALKPNQIGTLTEAMEVVKQVREAGWQVVVSHRSGETNDDFIADLAVGVGADFARFGPPNRGERVGKYNRLGQIDQQLAQTSTTPPVAEPT